jgi:hypothetical protein
MKTILMLMVGAAMAAAQVVVEHEKTDPTPLVTALLAEKASTAAVNAQLALYQPKEVMVAGLPELLVGNVSGGKFFDADGNANYANVATFAYTTPLANEAYIANATNATIDAFFQDINARLYTATEQAKLAALPTAAALNTTLAGKEPVIVNVASSEQNGGGAGYDREHNGRRQADQHGDGSGAGGETGDHRAGDYWAVLAR